MDWLCSWVWDSPPLPSCSTSSSSIKETRMSFTAFLLRVCSGSSLRLSTQSKNCSSDLGRPLLFLPSSQGFQPSTISPFSSLSPDFRLCAPISEVNIPFKTTQAGLRVYWVAEVNKLENVHSDSGRRVPETPYPSSPQSSSLGGKLESQHHCWVSRSLNLRAANGWSLSHTRKPTLGQELALRIGQSKEVDVFWAPAMASPSHLSDSIHVIHRDNCTKRLNMSVMLEENRLFQCPPLKGHTTETSTTRHKVEGWPKVSWYF